LGSQAESLIKKIEKAYQEIDPKNSIKNLKIEAKNTSPQHPEGYLGKWTWDDTKFARTNGVSN